MGNGDFSLLYLQRSFSSPSVILENVNDIRAHIECTCRVLGRGTQVLESPCWEEDFGLVELTSLTNKLVLEAERRGRDKKRNKQSSRDEP